ncbi:MAG: secretin N-terminal domain-containing protein [Thermodesulfobacteriota bacterium]|nr:secretin N-terminal domain-containing protein [Thermodesulfobacteriota bacterium]
MYKIISGKATVTVTFFILIFSFVAIAGPCYAEMIIIKIQNREASGVLPIVKTMLSGEGDAFADTLTNSIVINDSPESINKIREFLNHFDQPVPQLKIRIRFEEEGSSSERGVTISGRPSGKRWTVSTGQRRRDGLHLSVKDRKGNRNKYSETFIHVLSGSAAYINVGDMVPFTEQWIFLCRRYAHFGETVRFKHISTGMEVKPVMAGHLVHIDIVPRISYIRAGRPGVIRFMEASTRLIIPIGEWVRLGGDSKESNDVIRQILSVSTAESHHNLSLLLKVDL